jgi:hypothetical protein
MMSAPGSRGRNRLDRFGVVLHLDIRLVGSDGATAVDGAVIGYRGTVRLI